MSEFEWWWDRYNCDFDIYNFPKDSMKGAFSAGQSSSAARIAELEADCKVMAGWIHELSDDDSCTCPACTIAAKYREGK